MVSNTLHLNTIHKNHKKKKYTLIPKIHISHNIHMKNIDTIEIQDIRIHKTIHLGIKRQ